MQVAKSDGQQPTNPSGQVTGTEPEAHTAGGGDEPELPELPVEPFPFVVPNAVAQVRMHLARSEAWSRRAASLQSTTQSM